MNSFVKGLLCGALATLPMTLVTMVGMKALPAPTPEGEPDEWTPHHLTKKAAEAVVPGNLPEEAVFPFSVAGHVAYGSMMGGLYGLWRGERSGGAMSGVAFGLGVWAVSYGGWVPMAGLLRPPHREEPNRELRLILAHLTYGAALGLAYGRASEGSGD